MTTLSSRKRSRFVRESLSDGRPFETYFADVAKHVYCITMTQMWMAEMIDWLDDVSRNCSYCWRTEDVEPLRSPSGIVCGMASASQRNEIFAPSHFEITSDSPNDIFKLIKVAAGIPASTHDGDVWHKIVQHVRVIGDDSPSAPVEAASNRAASEHGMAGHDQRVQENSTRSLP